MQPKTTNPEMLLVALKTMAQSTTPTGARRLAEVFTQNGFETAEATAGRFLHRLDKLGLTEALGKQGRILSRKGRARLSELQMQQAINRDTAVVAAAFEVTHERELLGLLFARRAIESEAARLAAIYATEDEIEQMRRASEACHWVAHTERAEPAMAFHASIINGSHNALLSAVGTMLLNPSIEPAARLLLKDLSDRPGVDESMADDHDSIVAAIAARDSEEAERLMRAHIDGMIALAAIEAEGSADPRKKVDGTAITAPSTRTRQGRVKASSAGRTVRNASQAR